MLRSTCGDALLTLNFEKKICKLTVKIGNNFESFDIMCERHLPYLLYFCFPLAHISVRFSEGLLDDHVLPIPQQC